MIMRAQPSLDARDLSNKLSTIIQQNQVMIQQQADILKHEKNEDASLTATHETQLTAIKTRATIQKTNYGLELAISGLLLLVLVILGLVVRKLRPVPSSDPNGNGGIPLDVREHQDYHDAA